MAWAPFGFSTALRLTRVYRLTLIYETEASVNELGRAAIWASLHGRVLLELGRHGRVVMQGPTRTDGARQTYAIIFLAAPSVVERGGTFAGVRGSINTKVARGIIPTGWGDFTKVEYDTISAGGRERCLSNGTGGALNYAHLREWMQATTLETAASSLSSGGSAVVTGLQDARASLASTTTTFEGAAETAAEKAAYIAKMIKLTLIVLGAYAVAYVVTEGHPEKLLTKLKKGGGKK